MRSSTFAVRSSSFLGIVSSGNAWERRSQSYLDSGNGTLVIRYTFCERAATGLLHNSL